MMLRETACTLAVMATLLFAQGAQAADKSLSFYNTHTGETLSVVYSRGGRYDRKGVSAINDILKDHRTGGEVNINPALFDLLYGIKTTLEARKPGVSVRFGIISGYRSPQTNEMLRKNVGGQAKKSRHMHGDAIDIRVEGFSIEEVRNAAWCQKAGGVGYYVGSNFVHVDVYKKRTPDARFPSGSRYRAWGWSPVPGQCSNRTSS